MKAAEFDHAIRAAGAVLGVDEIIVIGSQALHATIPDPLPPEAARSVEVDVVPFDDADGSRADLVDGSIGEASMFHDTFGYYAQGVGESTAVLPRRLARAPRAVRVTCDQRGGRVVPRAARPLGLEGDRRTSERP